MSAPRYSDPGDPTLHESYSSYPYHVSSTFNQNPPGVASPGTTLSSSLFPMLDTGTSFMGCHPQGGTMPHNVVPQSNPESNLSLVQTAAMPPSGVSTSGEPQQAIDFADVFSSSGTVNSYASTGSYSPCFSQSHSPAITTSGETQLANSVGDARPSPGAAVGYSRGLVQSLSLPPPSQKWRAPMGTLPNWSVPHPGQWAAQTEPAPAFTPQHGHQTIFQQPEIMPHNAGLYPPSGDFNFAFPRDRAGPASHGYVLPQKQYMFGQGPPPVPVPHPYGQAHSQSGFPLIPVIHPITGETFYHDPHRRLLFLPLRRPPPMSSHPAANPVHTSSPLPGAPVGSRTSDPSRSIQIPSSGPLMPPSLASVAATANSVGQRSVQDAPPCIQVSQQEGNLVGSEGNCTPLKDDSLSAFEKCQQVLIVSPKSGRLNNRPIASLPRRAQVANVNVEPSSLPSPRGITTATTTEDRLIAPLPRRGSTTASAPPRSDDQEQVIDFSPGSPQTRQQFLEKARRYKKLGMEGANQFTDKKKEKSSVVPDAPKKRGRPRKVPANPDEPQPTLKKGRQPRANVGQSSTTIDPVAPAESQSSKKVEPKSRKRKARPSDPSNTNNKKTNQSNESAAPSPVAGSSSIGKTPQSGTTRDGKASQQKTAPIGTAVVPPSPVRSQSITGFISAGDFDVFTAIFQPGGTTPPIATSSSPAGSTDTGASVQSQSQANSTPVATSAPANSVGEVEENDQDDLFSEKSFKEADGSPADLSHKDDDKKSVGEVEDPKEAGSQVEASVVDKDDESDDGVEAAFDAACWSDDDDKKVDKEVDVGYDSWDDMYADD